MKAINITKLLLLSVCAIVFASCDNDTLILDVPLKNDVNVKFDAKVLPNQSQARPLAAVLSDQEVLSQFSGSIVLNRNDEAFKEITPHLNNLSSIDVGNALLVIQDPELRSYYAEDVEITAKSADSEEISFLIKQRYQFGNTFNDAEFTSFLLKVVLQLMFTNDTVTLNISGKTNALEGDNLGIHLTLQQVVLKVKTLQKK